MSVSEASMTVPNVLRTPSRSRFADEHPGWAPVLAGGTRLHPKSVQVRC